MDSKWPLNLLCSSHLPVSPCSSFLSITLLCCYFSLMNPCPGVDIVSSCKETTLPLAVQTGKKKEEEENKKRRSCQWLDLAGEQRTRNSQACQHLVCPRSSVVICFSNFIELGCFELLPPCKAIYSFGNKMKQRLPQLPDTSECNTKAVLLEYQRYFS